MGNVLTSRYTTLVERFFTTGQGWGLFFCFLRVCVFAVVLNRCFFILSYQDVLKRGFLFVVVEVMQPLVMTLLTLSNLPIV